MPAFDNRPELKTSYLDALNTKSAATIPNVLLLKPVTRENAARTSGSYINDMFPPKASAGGDIVGIPYPLLRQASDLEKTMPTQAARFSWTRSFIESIRPGANLADVSRLFACHRFDEAFPANEQYLTDEQKSVVCTVRELLATRSNSAASWRRAVYLAANRLLFDEISDSRRKTEVGMDEWRLFAAATEGSLNRMNNNEIKKNVESVAWISTELAYALLDPWWKQDGEAVLNYSRKLLELLRAA